MARFSLRRLLGPTQPIPGRLHVCPACGGAFVMPIGADLDEPGWWSLRLRCGACGHQRTTSVESSDASALYGTIAAQTQQIIDALEQLERERMSGWVESFSGALERDLIDAADFR